MTRINSSGTGGAMQPAGGSDTQVQFNNTGYLDGFGIWDGTNFIVNSSQNICVGLAPPIAISATADTMSGTLGAGTYYYVLVGRTIDGTTTQSNQVTATLGATGRIVLRFAIDDPAGIDSFDIYRSTTSGVYGATSFLANGTAFDLYNNYNNFPPYTYLYSDTGGSLSAGTPPTVNTAYAVKLGAITHLKGSLMYPMVYTIPGYFGSTVSTMVESNGFTSTLRAPMFIEPETELANQGDIPIFWAGKDTQGIAGTVGGYPLGLVWQALGYVINQFAFVDSQGNPQNLKIANLDSTTIKAEQGIWNNGGGLKHKRVSTGSVPGNGSALVTITWDGPAFSDTNYTVTVSVLDSSSAATSLSVLHIEGITENDISVRIVNNTADPITGTVHAIAMHDYSI